MPFTDDVKRILGDPFIDLVLQDDADYTLIKQRVLRTVRNYHPYEHIVPKDSPSSAGFPGEGVIDLATEDFIGITNVYVIRAKTGLNDIALPWSIMRVWEQAWLGSSEFMGTEILLYYNEVEMLNRVSNNRFGWQYDRVNKKLYVTNVPTFATGVGIQGLKGIDSLDVLPVTDIVYEYALKLAVALAKQKIGLILSKYQVEGMTMPGAEYKQEGKDEEKEALEFLQGQSVYPGGLNV